jgi:hypothetical protein
MFKKFKIEISETDLSTLDIREKERQKENVINEEVNLF